MRRRPIRILALVGTAAAEFLVSSQETTSPRVPAGDPAANAELESLQPASSPTASPLLRVASGETFADLHAALPHTMIVSVSAIWGDADVPGQLGAIDSAVETATTAAGGIYLDAGQPLSEDATDMHTDQIHPPTADGQLLIARAVQQAMLATGVTF